MRFPLVSSLGPRILATCYSADSHRHRGETEGGEGEKGAERREDDEMRDTRERGEGGLASLSFLWSSELSVRRRPRKRMLSNRFPLILNRP